ncbi:cytochrome b/b6 domain-containing protein [Caldovatus aquaticus]|uniref:Cytochrome b/b6 domain-containing protein n=1 Tax=Caldovatus aquaticus TaxID=2865671 RepID=A0ABS7EYC9_9PROT|nr:cytochrome b/b6 domain-containing protein [Caldovatus aquaticus]MBW8268370.1 cytochrome b/b6 domain-containing protein [Caldovatus aquaticus]
MPDDDARGTPRPSEATVRIRIWDGWVRLCHWALAALVAFSYGTARTGRMDWHLVSGHAILALVLFRIAWGFVGSETARFGTFLRSPSAALRHLARLPRREPDTGIGHNPAGGWMVVAMLALLLAQAATGLFADDEILTRGPLAQFVSERWVHRMTGLHQRLVNVLLAAVALHLLAVIAYAVLKRQDLVRPMLTGAKTLPAEAPAAQCPPRLGSPALGAALLGAAAAVSWLLWRLG